MLFRRTAGCAIAVCKVIGIAAALGSLFPAGVGLADLSEQARGPDLNVTMFRSGDDSRALIIPGGSMTISVGVGNLRGQAAAHNTVLTITLPRGLKSGETRPVPYKTQLNKGGTDLVWQLGTLVAGEFAHIFEVDVTAAPDVPTETSLEVSAKATGTDVVAGQNSIKVLSLRVKPAIADVVVTSNLNLQTFSIGQSVKFTASLSNWGTVPAILTSLKLTLPEMVSLISSEPATAGAKTGAISWQLGDIEPSGSRSVLVTIALDPSLATSRGDKTAGALLRFKIDGSTTTKDANPANNHLMIDKNVEPAGFDASVWLSVQGADTPGELPIGKEVTYTLTYGNFGNAPAPKSAVSLSLPTGLALLSADPAPASTTKSNTFPGGVAKWDGGDLNIGESKLIKCRVHVAAVPEDGSVVIAKVFADGMDINPANNTAYLWRRAPRGAAAQMSTAAGASLPAGPSHSYLWVWVVLLLAMAAVAWVLIRTKCKTREE